LFWENHQKHTIAIFVVEKHHHLIVNFHQEFQRCIGAKSRQLGVMVLHLVVTVVPNADLRLSKLAMNETSHMFNAVDGGNPKQPPGIKPQPL